MKKHNGHIRELVYIQMNDEIQYVLSYGIEFAEFARAIPSVLENILLLKHQFDDADFNMHTLLEYVPLERMEKIIKDDVYGYGDFCWIDFEEEDALNELTQLEIAELLYLGHLKQHLRTPFYRKLENKFVYLAHDDGWFNKTYYRNFTDFYTMLGKVIAQKMSELKIGRSIFGLGKRRPYPVIERETMYSLTELMKEGVVISLEMATQNRNRIEIPLWTVGDFVNMDDMYEEYERKSRNSCDAKLVFDRKARDWRVYRK